MTAPGGRTALGDLLENARVNVLQITAREAARRAGISESRWRQVVTGWQSGRGGTRIPAIPKVRTVIAMARAVRVDERAALAAAQIKIGDEALAALLEEAGQGFDQSPTGPPPPLDIDIEYEIDRVSRLDLSAQTKLKMVKKLIDLHEQAQAEREAQQRGA